MSIWIVYKDGQQVSAMPEQVRLWLEDGVISNHTLVFIEGYADWVNLGAVVDLLPLVQRPTENGKESARSEGTEARWLKVEDVFQNDILHFEGSVVGGAISSDRENPEPTLIDSDGRTSLSPAFASSKNRVAVGVASAVALAAVILLAYLFITSYSSKIPREAAEEEQAGSIRTAATQIRTNRIDGSRSTDGPPSNFTERDPCLEYKCGGYTAQVRSHGFVALADYRRPHDLFSVPVGSSFRHLDTVVVTERPTKASFKQRFVDPVSGYVFNEGDLIYLYASQGLGCWTAWSNGRGFKMPGSSGGADSAALCFDAYEEEAFLSYLQEGIRKAWNYAEFTIGDERRKLYYDPVAMQDLNCIPNYSC